MSDRALTAGARLRAAVEAERPLQVVGTINAYAALLAQRAGLRAIYLSGAGVANASFGLPDLGVTTLNDVCEDVRRITGAVRAAAPGGRRHRLRQRLQHRPHLPRPDPRRCRRHAPRGPGRGQALRPPPRQGAGAGRRDGATASRPRSMRAAIQAFVVMARTDALAVEGLDAALERAAAYVAAGADMIFAEAVRTLDEYRQFAARVNVPVLANITEFGQTPLFTLTELRARACASCSTRCRRSAPPPRLTRWCTGPCAARARRRASCPTCRRAPSSTRCSAITSTRGSSTSCSGKAHERRPQGKEIGGAVRRHGRQHGAVHVSGAPATTCTTAATTSSRSPTRASSRRSPFS